jgi:hypothetical protein
MARLLLISSSLPVQHTTLSELKHFAGQLTSFVNSQECYLKSLSPIFPTFDSFLYQHEMSQSGSQPLIGFQITTSHNHPISVKGLEAVKMCLKPQNSELKALRPTPATKWIILFVLPELMAVSFIKQRFKDAGKFSHWGLQYVLGLSEREVMRS